ncbi:unnamed protein product [Protopolystoma xenopodis]|uniref:Uncharacterized protein n=1 Tax=Protopolystoma xenopodis TaxID=117903 RepID=A0A3S5BW40_9PLAT|nr:unnamed protein product [Protopolystoma xenopodis]
MSARHAERHTIVDQFKYHLRHHIKPDGVNWSCKPFCEDALLFSHCLPFHPSRQGADRKADDWLSARSARPNAHLPHPLGLFGGSTIPALRTHVLQELPDPVPQSLHRRIDAVVDVDVAAALGRRHSVSLSHLPRPVRPSAARRRVGLSEGLLLQQSPRSGQALAQRTLQPRHQRIGAQLLQAAAHWLDPRPRPILPLFVFLSPKPTAMVSGRRRSSRAPPRRTAST